MKSSKFLMLAFLVLAIVPYSLAGPVPALMPTVEIAWDNGNGNAGDNGNWGFNFADGDFVRGEGEAWCVEKSLDNGNCQIEFDLEFDSDPYILASFSVINPTAHTQTYTLNFTISVSPAIVGGSLMGGSTGMTLTDNGTNSDIAAVGTSASTAFYSALIDGAEVFTLFDDPMSMSAPYNGGTAIQSADAGMPGPSLEGPDALETISIYHTFTLTANDSIGVTSYLEVVPEPATLMLLGSGMLLLRRKRS